MKSLGCNDHSLQVDFWNCRLIQTSLPAPYQEVSMDSHNDEPNAPSLSTVRCGESPIFLRPNLQIQALDIRSSETSLSTRLHGVTTQKQLILA